MSNEPSETTATISVRAGAFDCWSCGRETMIITGVDVSVGSNQWQLAVASFDRFPDLFHSIRSHIPAELEVGAIKPRYSRIQGRSYLSNGCRHCDALVGQFLEHHAWADQETKCAFSSHLTDRWRQAIAAACGEEPAEIGI